MLWRMDTGAALGATGAASRPSGPNANNVAGHRTGDNSARWQGNLSEVLPKPPKVAKVENYPALELGDLVQWWAALAQREGMAAKALQFLTLTAARSGEVRDMIWSAIEDLAEWQHRHAEELKAEVRRRNGGAEIVTLQK